MAPFWGYLVGILNMNHEKELPWSHGCTLLGVGVTIDPTFPKFPETLNPAPEVDPNPETLNLLNPKLYHETEGGQRKSYEL